MKLDDQPPAATGTADPAGRRRIALISDHASPLAAPGSIDFGGQDVYAAVLTDMRADVRAPIDPTQPQE